MAASSVDFNRRRYAVLTEGYLGKTQGKTAHGVLRYRARDVAVVIDSRYPNRTVNDIMPQLQSEAPIVESIGDALRYEPTSLLLGVATEGGRLPMEMRPAVLQAVDAGLEIVNGLHERMELDDEIVARAASSGARLWDVRHTTRRFPIFAGMAYDVRQHVVLAVGSDCAVGKMTAMLEIERAALKKRVRAAFLATGQTGIMITGSGFAVDAVVSDFICGAAEQLIVDAPADTDVLLVEGQGSIIHPAYAPVTFGLLYGTAPDALILCHRPGLTHINGYRVPIPDLATLIRAHTDVLRLVKPASVVAVVLDTSALTDEDSRKAILDAEAQTGLPGDDPVRHGGEKIWAAVAEALRTIPKAMVTR